MSSRRQAPAMESRLSTLATLWVRTEPHWRPQPAKLPSFGGYSLETLPINATGVIPAEMVILPLMTISAGMTPIVLLCFSPCYSPCYCAILLAFFPRCGSCFFDTPAAAPILEQPSEWCVNKHVGIRCLPMPAASCSLRVARNMHHTAPHTVLCVSGIQQGHANPELITLFL